ncbi:hypothetical protein Taro_041852, partial [Colocasia esculenta]|nr:hypothetical protein [Colocasia esculenta]
MAIPPLCGIHLHHQHLHLHQLPAATPSSTSLGTGGRRSMPGSSSPVGCSSGCGEISVLPLLFVRAAIHWARRRRNRIPVLKIFITSRISSSSVDENLSFFPWLKLKVTRKEQ